MRSGKTQARTTGPGRDQEAPGQPVREGRLPDAGARDEHAEVRHAAIPAEAADIRLTGGAHPPEAYGGRVSNLEREPAERTVCDGPAGVITEPAAEALEPREVPLGGPRAMLVRRSLPNRSRRMVGAWCFADAYGPADLSTRPGMRVPPHPHIGLQTVSWLVQGEILHRDSLGNEQYVRPGELNLMTAGRGIAHSEETPADHTPILHGAQLWVALPDTNREGPADFAHHADLPRVTLPGGEVTVLMGRVGDAESPARAFTPLVGAEIALREAGGVRMPLDPAYEHAVLALDAPLTVAGETITAGAMLYLGRDRTEVHVRSAAPGHALLIGGEPFEEPLVMWWNLVARTHEEIVVARTTWEDAPDSRYGTVAGYDGARLRAPALPNARLRARPRYRPHS